MRAALLLMAMAVGLEATETATATVEVVQAAEVRWPIDGGLQLLAPVSAQQQGGLVVFE